MTDLVLEGVDLATGLNYSILVHNYDGHGSMGGNPLEEDLNRWYKVCLKFEWYCLVMVCFSVNRGYTNYILYRKATLHSSLFVPHL